MFHLNGLQGCWAPLPPIQAITTGSDAHIAQELGAMRRVQGEVTANKKKVTQKGWRVVLVTKLLSLARVPSKEDPLYTTLAVGKGVTQVSILTQNTFVAYCLEVGPVMLQILWFMPVASFGTSQMHNISPIVIPIPTESTMAIVCPAARDESCTFLCLQRKNQLPELFLLQLLRQKHGGLSGWQNALSGKLTQSKLPTLHTLPTTLRHLPTKYAGRSSYSRYVVTFQSF